jgi:hypothetical protein
MIQLPNQHKVGQKRINNFSFLFVGENPRPLALTLRVKEQKAFFYPGIARNSPVVSDIITYLPFDYHVLPRGPARQDGGTLKGERARPGRGGPRPRGPHRRLK